ncbi:MAG: type IX secretion system membrane protein PorP/SprF [Flavobacteriales bacterium]|jgi:type IX secretion system PorP/SprF family membrane protein|nr:type IX secretion system membrane protein PorP/SprF [Flavobacteriales bacterium]
MNRNKKSMNKSIILIITVFMLSGLIMKAQQDAVTSQFVMNKMFINPGYTGYKEQALLTAVHRSQWLGFKGAPSTQTLSFDTPLKKNELAAGGLLIHDKVGPTSRFGLMANFAYRTRLSNRATLSWGASASVDLYQMNLTDLTLASDYYGTQDEVFMSNVKGLILPNVGFGAYYHKKDHFIGLSCPKMLRPKLEKKGSPAFALLNGREEPTIYMMGGKQFKVNKDLFLIPSMLIRSQWNAPMSVGIYANAIYMKDFNFGLYYHYREIVGLMFQWQLDKQIKIGYSADIPTNVLIRNNWGSHELAVNYALNSSKKRIVYPRYF